jgi:hypothetical protein
MSDTGPDSLPEDTRRTETKSGSDARGAGIAIGGLNVALYVILPALIVVCVWTLISVYAIVKWIGSAPEEPNPVVIILGVVLTVTLLVVLFAVAVGLVGRSMNPKKRAKD